MEELLTLRILKRTYFTTFSSVSIVDFEQVNVSWVMTYFCEISRCLPGF